MASLLELATLTEPLKGADPCGPDLEEEGDLDFLNGLSRAEALLPASFFSRDDEGRPQPFDRSSIDFGGERKSLLALLDKTRDVRILTLLARLAMLERDLAGFVTALSAIATLLEDFWDAVHPRGEGGGFDLRNAILHALEDVPTVILPLQHIVLAQSRRHGALTFRNVMIADGEVPARDGDTAPDRTAIERAIEEVEPAILADLIATFSTLVTTVGRIGTVTVARGGYAGAVNLERLGGLADRIRDFLTRLQPVTGDAPAATDSAATPTAAAIATAPHQAGHLATVPQASAALAAAGAYLRSHEPSSPAEVLVRQAQMLVGMSFLDVMRVLVPANAVDATIAFGANRTLRLTFEQLCAVPTDSPASEETADDADTDEADAPPVPIFRASTRAQAMTLIRDVGSFFRSHEPSSPIPLLLEKATGLADRDFLAILREVLPDLDAS